MKINDLNRLLQVVTEAKSVDGNMQFRLENDKGKGFEVEGLFVPDVNGRLVFVVRPAMYREQLITSRHRA